MPVGGWREEGLTQGEGARQTGEGGKSMAGNAAGPAATPSAEAPVETPLPMKSVRSTAVVGEQERGGPAA